MHDHQQGGGAVGGGAVESEPVLCSGWSTALAEPTAGTAPVARSWLAVEQPGPWGRAALGQSHLDPALGQALDLRSAGSGTKVVLVRRPGRHPDDHVLHRREVLVAHTVPGRTWLRRAWVEDPAVLLELDLAALGRGEADALSPLGPVETVEDPVLLVCTNGRRDRCCAILGRPLAEALARDERWHEHVLEVTHLGGHRFSPTAVLLPWGLAYGRLDQAAAHELLAGAGQGRMLLEGLRGRSTWDRAGQAAEAAVRQAEELTGLDDVVAVRRLPDLSTEHGEHGEHAVREVAAADGRRWQVALDVVAAQPPRPESCGKAPARPEHFLAGQPRRV
ncbi:MAG TPA: sucrase ferredoxin [Motilibacteraceae bacterium]|nr:sucrase ferredoxin [Motilibacteraceae bacterium]